MNGMKKRWTDNSYTSVRNFYLYSVLAIYILNGQVFGFLSVLRLAGGLANLPSL